MPNALFDILYILYFFQMAIVFSTICVPVNLCRKFIVASNNVRFSKPYYRRNQICNNALICDKLISVFNFSNANDPCCTDSVRRASGCWRRNEYRPMTLKRGSAAPKRGPWPVPRNVLSATSWSQPLPSDLADSRRQSDVVDESCAGRRTVGWCWASRGRHRRLEGGCHRQRHSVHSLAVQWPQCMFTGCPATTVSRRRSASMHALSKYTRLTGSVRDQIIQQTPMYTLAVKNR